MADTIIAWTDFTFNPWMGCSKVSAGCKNCYAERLTRDRMGLNLWGEGALRQVTKTPWSNIREQQRMAMRGVAGVLGEGYPRLVFVGSLMDWAEDRDELIEPRKALWSVIRKSPNLCFQLLTKRPENIRKMLPEDWGGGWANVWLGTSVENMALSFRVDDLRSIPASVRFISYEPALGPLDDLDLNGINWVIYGGESGPNYRPENKDWARAMKHKCATSGIAFFHKQSAAYRTETGIELDNEIIQEYPIKHIKMNKTSLF